MNKIEFPVKGLYCRNGVYYFRKVIPTKFRKSGYPSEIVLSLKPVMKALLWLVMPMRNRPLKKNLWRCVVAIMLRRAALIFPNHNSGRAHKEEYFKTFVV